MEIRVIRGDIKTQSVKRVWIFLLNDAAHFPYLAPGTNVTIKSPSFPPFNFLEIASVHISVSDTILLHFQ